MTSLGISCKAARAQCCQNVRPENCVCEFWLFIWLKSYSFLFPGSSILFPFLTLSPGQMGYTSLHFYVFQSRLREMVEYDDLAELQASELPSLKIADSTKFSQGLIPAIPKVNNGKKIKSFVISHSYYTRCDWSILSCFVTKMFCSLLL